MHEQFALTQFKAKSDWPLIEDDEARGVLKEFGVTVHERPLWHSARPFSSAIGYQDHLGSRYFLKRHATALRNNAGLREEHLFIQHLARKGLSVASPVKRSQQRTTLVREGWCYECFPELSGKDLYRDQPSWKPYFSSAHAFQAGRAMAKFHFASTEWKGPNRAQRPLVSALSPLLGERPAESLRTWVTSDRLLGSVIDPEKWVHDVLPALSPHLARLQTILSYLTPCWGHGDWHGSNLMWSESGQEVNGPFDFGMADCTTKTFDIAVAIERSMIEWMCPQDGRLHVYTDHVASFLNGYASEAPLSPDELRQISIFLPVCHVVFALSETWYYAVLLKNDDSADAAFTSYLINHANWFSTPQGGSLRRQVACHGQG